MKIIKRSGTEVVFDIDKIVNAIAPPTWRSRRALV
ncbi:MAG: ATP cone domain-containing protein [Collinsella sp.]